MPHPRQLIRDAAVAALLSATAAGVRVFPTRALPLRRVELPAIAVYAISETSEDAGDVPRELTRNLTILIEGWVAPTTSSGTSVDDAMDDLALEIEAAMEVDVYLGATVADKGVELTETDLAVLEDGDRLMGLVVMSYSATYRTESPMTTADASLDDFETVEATHNLGNAVDPGDEASDLFTVEE